MKTKIGKISLALFIVVAAITLSSFTGSKVNNKEINSEVTVTKYGSEYTLVRDFIEENITNPIREQGKANGVVIKSFSRCPSGYQQRIAGPSDSVKANIFVYGKINLYKGCSPQHVCDFKVCVEKDIAEVKSKGSKEYISVREWLEDNNFKKDEDVKTTKESAKEIKG